MLKPIYTYDAKFHHINLYGDGDHGIGIQSKGALKNDVVFYAKDINAIILHASDVPGQLTFALKNGPDRVIDFFKREDANECLILVKHLSYYRGRIIDAKTMWDKP